MGNVAAAVDSEHARRVPIRGFDQIIRSPAEFVDNLPIGIYVCDADGVLTQYNARAAELWGLKPNLGNSGLRFCGALHAFRLDGTPIPPDQSPMAEALRTEEAVRDREMIFRKPTGERITIVANVNPMFDDDGRLTGGVSCIQDITELRRIQSEQNEGRHVVRTVLDAIPAPLYATDHDGYLTYYNPAAAQFWGLEPELRRQRWCGSWKLLHEDGRPMAHDECPMATAIKEQRAVRGPTAIAERPDGTRVPFMPYPTPIFGTDGKLVGAVNLLFDLTEIKRAEAQQKAMIDELNHRVKNTLATVQSLAAQTFRDEARPGDASRAAFEARLLALSKTHDHLTRQSWEWADLKAIVQDTMAPYRAEQITLSGPSVHLTSKMALSLSMVLHELATNAAKYGALSAPDGRLEVSWIAQTMGGERHLSLAWTESHGPAVTPPTRRGFGSKLIERTIAQDLGGTAEAVFDRGGLRYTCDVVLSR